MLIFSVTLKQFEIESNRGFYVSGSTTKVDLFY